MSTSPVPEDQHLPSPAADPIVDSREASNSVSETVSPAQPSLHQHSRRASRLEVTESSNGVVMRRVSVGGADSLSATVRKTPTGADARNVTRRGNRGTEYVDDTDDQEMVTLEVPQSGAAGQRGSPTHSHRSSNGSGGEPMFTFINVENNRLERERVIAIIDPSHMTWVHRWFCILEGRPHTQDETLTLVFNMTSIFFVLISCVVFLVQSLPENTNNNTSKEQDYLFWIETGCIIFFVAEASLRVWCVPLSHLFTKFFAVDLITIAGYLADLMSFTSFASSFSPLRLIRVFRIFKLSRYSSNLQLVFTVLKASAPGLSMLALPLLLVALTASSIIFYFEVWDATFDKQARRWMRSNGNPTVIQSIPDALWFSIVTMTTVGYGDIVPETPMGKIVAVILMFTGVLTLSFPNIVLGVNLQTALRERKQHGASASQFMAFKKVVHAVAFIRRVQYWVAIRKAREMSLHRQASMCDLNSMANPSSRSQEFALRANFAYFPTAADFESHRKPTIEPVTIANLRHWTYKGVDAVTLLQTILESYSGVATCEEIYSTLLDSGLSADVRQKDIALCLLYLGEAKILKIFVLVRNTTNMVAALTEPAVTELLLHSERATGTCHRSAEFARFMWKQTTGQLVPYSLALLFTVYTTWSRRERYAEDDTVPDLRTTIEMPEETREALFSQESFRGNMVLGRSIVRAATMVRRRHDSNGGTALLEEGIQILKSMIKDSHSPAVSSSSAAVAPAT